MGLHGHPGWSGGWRREPLWGRRVMAGPVLIATPGLATDAPDEGSGPARRGRARLQHMSGSRGWRGPWDRGLMVRRFCGRAGANRYATQGRRDGSPTPGRHRPGHRDCAHGAGPRRRGRHVAKRKAWPTAESLSEMEAAALAGCPEGTRLEVVIEPTGRRGCRSRCSSPPAGIGCSGCRRRRRRTCAGSCPGTPRATASTPTPWPGSRCSTRPGCGRWCCPAPSGPPWTGGCARRIGSPARSPTHKRRIKDLVRQLMPMSPLTGELGAADLAVLERYADPNALVQGMQAG